MIRGVLLRLLIALIAGVALTYAVAAAIVIAAPKPAQSDSRDAVGSDRYNWDLTRQRARGVERWITRCQGHWTIDRNYAAYREPLRVAEIPDWLDDALAQRETELDERIAKLPQATSASAIVPGANHFEYTFVDESIGWPWLALRSESLIDSSAAPGPIRSTRWGLPSRSTLPPRPQTAMSPFPLMPVWPGFASNAAVFSICVWFVLCVPFIGRRVHRRRRGRCTRCAYDLRSLASGQCPECGHVSANDSRA